MNKLYVGYSLIFTSTILIIFMTIFKRKLMSGFESINFFSPKFWVTLPLNYMFWIIIVLGGLSFLLNLTAFHFIEIKEAVIFNWAIVIPAFMFNIYLATIFLGEKVESSQYKYLLILTFSMIIAMFGIVGYVKNG